MAEVHRRKLKTIDRIIRDGLTPAATAEIMRLLGAPPMEPEELEHLRLYSETLPKAEEFPYTPQTRHLHFLWDLFDKLPLRLSAPFSIPLRRLLSEHLFAKSGGGLVAEENVRFNFPQLLRVGEGVFFNRGVFLDTKGGVEIGDFAALAEDVTVFTHNHDEASHIKRTYAPVTVEPYAKIYAGAVLLPGVTVGREAIVAARSVVSRDVPPGMVAAGTPAKVIRERRTDGRHDYELDHVWLF
ncbi:acyltransferase [Pseudodesulfovibrio sp.]|uniref:acyltransferase n=1 Tax=Pseudodesulfovibrio sp. TaxID=2035812 RepID=UPI00260CEEFB|nr:acyltransferase [Pseudodesulfovibrio sp.]MDD3313033.1 acyltransferase [Pseudodesulfovibrio sp.]